MQKQFFRQFFPLILLKGQDSDQKARIVAKFCKIFFVFFFAFVLEGYTKTNISPLFPSYPFKGPGFRSKGQDCCQILYKPLEF